MEVFDLRVSLRTEAVRLFVIPFEIQSAAPTMGYLLVHDQVSLGSIYLDKDYQWATNEFLPWDFEDLQLIGKEIETQYFLFQN